MSRIEKNEQILFIPMKQLITLELARSLPLVQKMISAKIPLRSPKHTQLAIFLLEQFELEPLPMHIVYAERKPVPLKLRAFLNWVTPRLKARLA